MFRSLQLCRFPFLKCFSLLREEKFLFVVFFNSHFLYFYYSHFTILIIFFNSHLKYFFLLIFLFKFDFQRFFFFFEKNIFFLFLSSIFSNTHNRCCTFFIFILYSVTYFNGQQSWTNGKQLNWMLFCCSKIQQQHTYVKQTCFVMLWLCCYCVSSFLYSAKDICRKDFNYITLNQRNGNDNDNDDYHNNKKNQKRFCTGNKLKTQHGIC